MTGFLVHSHIYVCQLSLSLYQESKKHLAGLGSLGLGSLITEITASEEDTAEQEQDQSNTDAEGLSVFLSFENLSPCARFVHLQERCDKIT